jgi:hypothetical protein
MQRSGPLRLRDLLQRDGRQEKPETRTKTRVLKRLDELIDFFETSPFFQDEESRDVLLEQLSLERASWEKKNWEEIIANDTPT